jgi:hypothetical protein
MNKNKRCYVLQKIELHKGPDLIFFKNVHHSLSWSSFEEIDELFPKLCRIKSETARSESFDSAKYLHP